MRLCLTFHVNLGLSLRKTFMALKDFNKIKVSPAMIANYWKPATVIINLFADHFNYDKSDAYIADETFIKVTDVKGYIRFLRDVVSMSVIGCFVIPCILAMSMAYKRVMRITKNFKLIADGYIAYPLSAQ